MQKMRRKVVWVLMSTFALGIANPAAADQKNQWVASKSEAALLPPFCWKQMMDPSLEGPEYTIGSCGPAMNHYCLGLLAEIRANKTFGNKADRIGYLWTAYGNVNATVGGMKAFPECPLQEQVFTSMARIKNQLRAYGAKF